MRKILHDFERYLVTEKMVAGNTVSAYMSDLQQFVTFAQKHHITNHADITKQLIKDFILYLKKEVEVGPASMSRKLSALKSWCAWLVKRKHGTDFMLGVTFPKLPKKLPKFLSQEDMQTILQTAAQDTSLPGKRNSLMIAVLYACGMRVSELVSIQISHIQFDEGLVRVHGKGEKERLIPLPVQIVKALQEYLTGVHKELHAHLPQTQYLFPVVHGKRVKPMSRHSFWMVLRRLVLQAGLDPELVSPHVLRHSLATHLMNNGANLRFLQMLLGHQNLETLQVYTHVDVRHLRKLYDKYHTRA